MTLLFQEDDCAPDAYEYFCKKFKQEVGIEFQEWKIGKLIDDEEIISYEDDKYLAEIRQDDPYWKLYKK